MMSGDLVRWSVESGAAHTGVFVRPIPAGDMPALPDGVSRGRAKFRASPSLRDRVLVRELVTGLYYAPRAASLSVLATEDPAQIR